MGAFDFQALDERGRTKRGVASGDTARQVRQQLREQGLTPISVEAVSEGRSGRGGRSKNKAVKSARVSGRASRVKMNQTELAVVTRQFSTLLSSGLTIEDSLNALIAQSETHQAKSTLSAIRSMVMEGSTLADALRAFPKTFPELYTASVAAGEETGHLDTVFDRLADFTETSQGLRQRISLALVYPLFLVITAIAIVVGLLTYVVPKVVKVFSDTGNELPVLTKVMISSSDFLREYGIYIFLVLAIGLMIFMFIFRQPGPKKLLHGFFLRVPGIKKFSRTQNSARMGRTLAIMVGSGVPLLSSIKATEGVVSNLVMRDALRQAASEVQEGVSLGRALQRTERFPPLLVQMVSSGEQSGTLDKMLDKSAMTMERELESRVGVMVGLFEPVMMLVMGGMVLLIVLAILMPIFDLNQAIN